MFNVLACKTARHATKGALHLHVPHNNDLPQTMFYRLTEAVLDNVGDLDAPNICRLLQALRGLVHKGKSAHPVR